MYPVKCHPLVRMVEGVPVSPGSVTGMTEVSIPRHMYHSNHSKGVQNHAKRSNCDTERAGSSQANTVGNFTNESEQNQGIASATHLGYEASTLRMRAMMSPTANHRADEGPGRAAQIVYCPFEEVSVSTKDRAVKVLKYDGFADK